MWFGGNISRVKCKARGWNGKLGSDRVFHGLVLMALLWEVGALGRFSAVSGVKNETGEPALGSICLIVSELRHIAEVQRGRLAKGLEVRRPGARFWMLRSVAQFLCRWGPLPGRETTA